MAEPDPYLGWPLSDRLQLLAFEAELAHLPCSLIAALWEAIDSPVNDRCGGKGHRPRRSPEDFHLETRNAPLGERGY